MRYAIRLFVCLCACGAAFATPTAAHAAVPEVGARWPVSNRVDLVDIAYAGLSGDLTASRPTVADDASVCLHLWNATSQRDGSTRVDVVNGCSLEAPANAYTFNPVRWTGTVAVRFPLEKYTNTVRADGSVVQGDPVSAGTATVNLRWKGVGDPFVDPFVHTYFLTPFVDVTVSRDAFVDGSITIGSDVVRVNRGEGQMVTGEAA